MLGTRCFSHLLGNKYISGIHQHKPRKICGHRHLVPPTAEISGRAHLVAKCGHAPNTPVMCHFPVSLLHAPAYYTQFPPIKISICKLSRGESIQYSLRCSQVSFTVDLDYMIDLGEKMTSCLIHFKAGYARANSQRSPPGGEGGCTNYHATSSHHWFWIRL